MLKAVLIGNLGADPEMRYSAEGRPFARFNVACNYRARSQEGEWQDRTEWVRVTVTGQRAETITQYLRKGSKVYVEGRLEARPWTDQQQQIRPGLEVLANEIQFMSSRSDDEGMAARSGAPRESGEGSPAPAPRANNPRPAAAAQSDEADLEDLPF